MLSPRMDRILAVVDGEDLESYERLAGATNATGSVFQTRGGKLGVVLSGLSADLDDLLAKQATLTRTKGVIRSSPIFTIRDGEQEADIVLFDEIIMHVKAGLEDSDRKSLLADYGLEIIDEYPAHSGRLLVRTSAETLDTVALLYADDRVELASPDFYYERTEYGCPFPVQGHGGGTNCAPPPLPNGSGYDPKAPTQWQWDVACVWQAWQVPGDFPRGGETVAITEASQIDTTHPDLTPNFLEEKDLWDPNNPPGVGHHGTAVAGIVVADDNGKGVMGVAPDSKLIWIRNACTYDDFTDASNLYWAANKGIRIFNISHGNYQINDDYLRAVRKVTTEELQDVAGSRGAGMIITIAVGNNGTGTNFAIPAYHLSSHPLVLAVGGSKVALDGSEERDCRTWYGQPLDLVAPNRKIFQGGIERAWTTLSITNPADPNDENYRCFTDLTNSGSSFCAPFVAGVAALMISRDSSLSRTDVFQILFHSASKVFSLNTDCPPTVTGLDPVTGHSPFFGYGRVDAEDAVTFVERGTRWPEPALDFSAEPVVNGASLAISLRWRNPDRNFTKVVIFKSTASGSRLLFAPPDGQGFSVGNTVLGGLGRVIYVGNASTYTDGETNPTGLRYYTIFSYYDSAEDNDVFTPGVQAVTVKRYSFGAETTIRKGTLYAVSSPSSLQSTLNAQDLEGGDVVQLATGNYSLSAPIVWPSSDQGSADNGHVYFIGSAVPTSTSGSFLVAGAGFPAGVGALQVDGQYLTVKHFGFRGFTSGSAIEIPPTPGLEEHWKLDNNASNSSGSTNLQILNGATPIYSSSSRIGSHCVPLDGIDDYLSAGSFNVLSSFTIAAWVKADSTQTNSQTVAANTSGGATANGFKLLVNTNGTTDRKIIFETGNGTFNNSASTAAGVCAFDQWNHVAVVVDRAAGTAKIYYNGIDVTSDGSVQTDFATNATFEFGRRLTGGLYLKGFLDDVRVYSRLLIPDDIAVLAAPGGTTRFLSNRIIDCKTGILLNGEARSDRVLVQNNVISNVGAQTISGAKGVHCATAPELQPGGFGGYYSIINNTIVLDGGGGVKVDFNPNTCTSFTCIGYLAIGALGPTVSIYNNILDVKGSGNVCLEIPSGRLFSNNNFLRSGSASSARIGTASYDLAGWRANAYADKDSIDGYLAQAPNIVLDPQYVGADFRLGAQSECINRGQMIDLRGLYDLDQSAGNRVEGGRPDLGADEVDAPTLGGKFIRGDADGSGTVNLTDVLFIRNFLFLGTSPPPCLDAADVDDDEDIDLTDSVFLNNYLFFGIDNGTGAFWIPPPFPACGVDSFGFVGHIGGTQQSFFCSQSSSQCGP